MENSFMQIFKQLEEIPPLSPPIALTIGTYDGVHLGHQHLFQELKKRGTSVVLTFSNHPAEVLRPHAAPTLIDTTDQKLRRLEKCGVDIAIVLPFTPELANLAYDAFLKKIRLHLPFTHLVHGEGSAFGKGAEGHEQNIRTLASELGFEAIYLPKLTLDGEAVTTTRIRQLIESRNFEQAFRLLGRPQGHLW